MSANASANNNSAATTTANSSSKGATATANVTATATANATATAPTSLRRTKRKRSVISKMDKQMIVARLDKGEKGIDLAEEFGISKQQVSDIRRDRKKFLPPIIDKGTTATTTTATVDKTTTTTATRKRRKRSVISIHDKGIILSRLENGEKGVNLAEEFGISKQQISDIRKNREKILKFTKNNNHHKGGDDETATSEPEFLNNSNNRKSLKLANDERLDQVLYKWYVEQTSLGTPLSGPILQEQARKLSRQLNSSSSHTKLTTTFKASNGWLRKFKNRHGIRALNEQEEKKKKARKKKKQQVPVISNAEAVECFQKCLGWMEFQQQQDKKDTIQNVVDPVDPVQIVYLRRMRDFAMRKTANCR